MPLIRPVRRLWSDRRGLALIEFAYVMPLLLLIGAAGLETANFMLMNLRISQAAGNLADNVSRVGRANNLGVKQIREADIIDSFQALRIQSSRYGLVANGRVTLSSLERNSSNGQWIHWQRCIGQKRDAAFQSRYGREGDGATGTAFPGMGPKGQEITAPSGSGVMFVDMSYTYQPLFSDALMGSLVGSIYKDRVIRSHSAFVVRDQRLYDNANNPAPTSGATVLSCTQYLS